VIALSTDAATDVGPVSATLNGSFIGNAEDTHYFFEWGADTTYGHQTAASPGTDFGSPPGPGPSALSFDLDGLAAQTTYHYRVVASNGTGTSFGEDRELTTAPAVAGVQTEAATDLTASSATLHGSFAGNGEDTHYFFEWGTDTSYGKAAPLTPGDAGQGSGTQNESAPLEGLAPDSTYHYRLVVSNAEGTTFGRDRTLTTLGRYQYSTALGAPGEGDGQLSDPQDVAVADSSGDLYVADTSNHRIVRFGPSGNFVSAWGWGVEDGASGYEVCTAGCQAGLAGSGPGQLTTPAFVEVDNSGGPSDGDVYVADKADGVVQKFDPSGALVSGWGSGGAIDFSHGGTVGGITVDGSGDLYVLTDTSPFLWTEVGQDGVFKTQYPTNNTYNGGQLLNLGTPAGTGIEISSQGAFYELQPPGSSGGVKYASPNTTIYSSFRVYLGTTLSDSGIAIDRSADDLFVDQGNHIDWFPGAVGCGANVGGAGAKGPPGCNPSESFGKGILKEAAGLAVQRSSGVVYAANSSSGDVAVFSPRPVPAVSTGPVANPGPTSATLTGHVDPQASASVAECRFEYGTDINYDLGSVPCAPAAPLSGPADVSAELTGLTPFTTYHYRLLASSSDGQGYPAYGRDRSFVAMPTAAPSVDASSSSGVGSTAATLSARINPNQAATVFRFEYGLSTAYESRSPVSESIGEDGEDHSVSARITGLEPGATYHFRVVAININGVTAGPDQTFDTEDLPAVEGSAASAITASSATLGARIQPGFSPTSYHFEYGASPAYGAASPQTALPAADDSFHPVSAGLAGLAPGTTYHFRIVATNAVGTTAGPDQVFTTAAAAVTPPPPSRRACPKGKVRRKGKCVKRKHRHHPGKRGHHHKKKHGKKHRRSHRS
jgi:phosphodiesterase/alkaline phosphatase D-like protein